LLLNFLTVVIDRRSSQPRESIYCENSSKLKELNKEIKMELKCTIVPDFDESLTSFGSLVYFTTNYPSASNNLNM